ncbi:HAMP domain-containing sensor histidine kinase [Sphaerotilus sp.]|uniref:sensor histidine kinase n=1 Tax=Sphaerotilus sp. TaxID=2093942 RepID=UPI002ACD2E5A|nr:HAMP domain-containing sensor histidine kinase [Sphaerotilus sp.]MDZ7857773.1 HAMP domain-containing sensor histidine kinase [Sphaerotilus sp.]
MRWRGLVGLGGVRSLYLRIYLTVVVALLVFALLAAWLVSRHTEAERGRIDVAVSERTLAFASLLENSLPPAGVAAEVQRQAVLDWSRRLRMPIALDAPDGERIGVSPFYERKVRPDRADEETVASRIPLADGRVLWVLRPGGLRPFTEGPPPERPSDRGAPRGPDHGHGGSPHASPSRWLGLVRKPGWVDDASALFMLLATLFVAVTAGAYPVVRRLTRRLEALERGVEQFGAGDLGHRVDAEGRDEVAAVALSFNRAAQRIEDLVRANRALLANASHELRSPLARLKMAVEMVEDASPEQRQALRSEIDRDICELDGLVEEVLLASRLDAQVALRIEPVDLLGLLVEEAARVGASAEGEAVLVQADERLLRRALRNLLENARRYGGDEVEATVRRGQAGQVEVQVCDRGPGVPSACREQVFEPFFRLPGHAERAGGVGLGLSLVRQIATRHGGSVRCLAREGGGSCFLITLPCEAVAGPG